MAIRKTAFFLLYSILAMAAAAHAQDPAKLAKVDEFFKLAKIDQLSTQIFDQAQQQINSSLMGNLMGVTLTAEQQKHFNDLQAQLRPVLLKGLGWEALEPSYAKLFADAYTDQQLDDLITFYKSPTGQAMVEKQPALMAQASAIVQQRLQDVMPELQKIMRDSVQQTSSTPPPAR